jgi:hypothetical protein
MKCGRSRDTYQEPQALRSALFTNCHRGTEARSNVTIASYQSHQAPEHPDQIFERSMRLMR